MPEPDEAPELAAVVRLHAVLEPDVVPESAGVVRPHGVPELDEVPELAGAVRLHGAPEPHEAPLPGVAQSVELLQAVSPGRRVAASA